MSEIDHDACAKMTDIEAAELRVRAEIRLNRIAAIYVAVIATLCFLSVIFGWSVSLP